MKKSTGLVTLVVVLAAVYGGSTWYTGKKTEALVSGKVAEFNTLAAEQLQQMGMNESVVMNVVDYQRGVFSSTARYTITVKPADAQEKPLELTFEDKISHGPLPMSALALGNFTPVAALSHSTLVKTKDTEGWFKLTGDKTPLWADSLVGFDGAVDSNMHFEAIKHQGDEIKVDFSGGQLRTKAGGKSKDIVVTGSFPKLFVDDISEDPLKLEASNFMVDFKQNGDINVNGTQVGKLSVDNIKMQTAETDGITFKQIALNSDAVTKDSISDTKISYQLSDLVFEDKIKLGSAELVMSFDRVSAPAISALSKLVSDSNLQNDLDSVDSATADKMMELVLQALENKPVLRVEPLRWYTAAGESKATLRMDFQKPNASLQELKESPELWVEAIPAAQLDVLISKPMLRDLATEMDKAEGTSAEAGNAAMLDMILDAAVAPYAESKMLKNDENGVSTAIKYDGKDRVFDINGQRFTSEQLLGLVLMGMM
ncbi:YdgA family protein [Alcaligenes parafaecalis]|uniref:YdgA family protein n=1 Tax=Alcaligenes parafaecalis TaxID=171260 RepID=A0ABT3VNW5_9BURK|nr:YdgA family protein [Alcaligenes parafaecalis]MCX5463826.1 YdgA family protein [Alcaligenes parafaecalis]